MGNCVLASERDELVQRRARGHDGLYGGGSVQYKRHTHTHTANLHLASGVNANFTTQYRFIQR